MRSIRLICILLLLASPLALKAQRLSLRSGPMVGPQQMREASLWLQTDKFTDVIYEYWDARYPDSAHSTTKGVLTDGDNIAKTLISGLEPGQTYFYKVYLSGRTVKIPYPMHFTTAPLWQWRSDPPNTRIALGSCAFVADSLYDRPGKPYGGGYEIFTSIAEQKPDAMLWLGDNTYLREADWNTKLGILSRYGHTRALPQMQNLLSNAHHYAIWDDHDYGPNDCDRSWIGKEWAKSAFNKFWLNPENGAVQGGGIFTKAEIADVDFFLMDDRWYRTSTDLKTAPQQVLGPEQMGWLIDALKFSRATFKFVAIGSQVLNPLPVFEVMANYGGERDSLIARITRENITGVIFLSGDRHFTEVTKLDRPGTYPLYDFTISPLTSSAFSGAEKEANPLRVPGTIVTERNFAIMSLGGPRDARTLQITVHKGDGSVAWTRTLTAAELK